MKFILIQCLLTIAFLTNVALFQNCGRNERYNICSSSCEPTCGLDPNRPCTLQCGPPKCQCMVGYMRNPTTKQCVKENECNSTGTTSCDENEQYNTCSSYCEPVCGEDDNKPCILSCGPPKCQCKSGYKRNPKTGKCVRSNECTPTTTIRSISCGINEVFAQCSTRCEATCSNRNPTCPLVCDPPRCQCAPGYVRAPMSAECIKAEECDKPAKPECGQNAMYVKCSITCEATCEDPKPVCNRMCGPPKCQCLEGFVKDLNTGECVLPRKCSKPSNQQCRRNEEYAKCSKTCTASCDDPYPVCNKMCGPPKCQCKMGYVKDLTTGECITLSSCRSSSPPQCGKNEEYAKCSRTCVATCKDPNPICNEMCGPPKCQCKQGYVKDKGNCIKKNKCR
uniref:TIL domain-containing protein n=1 Tax=Parastrongyloides trichosuri TaxID=131310 RepID=A0A0N4Z5T2_PARTI